MRVSKFSLNKGFPIEWICCEQHPMTDRFKLPKLNDTSFQKSIWTSLNLFVCCIIYKAIFTKLFLQSEKNSITIFSQVIGKIISFSKTFLLKWRFKKASKTFQMKFHWFPSFSISIWGFEAPPFQGLLIKVAKIR